MNSGGDGKKNMPRTAIPRYGIRFEIYQHHQSKLDTETLNPGSAPPKAIKKPRQPVYGKGRLYEEQLHVIENMNGQLVRLGLHLPKGVV